MSNLIKIPRRAIFNKLFGKTEKPLRTLIGVDEQLIIDRYRGQLDDFLLNFENYEDYLDFEDGNADTQPMTRRNGQKIAGKCTPEGTFKYASDAVVKHGLPKMNFRKPILPDTDKIDFHLSTIGLGTYLGLPDDATDFDVYNAAKALLLSGGVNVLDTAINYRCQKAERALGAALWTLTQKHGLNRDQIFVCSKNGYIPDDADQGKSATMLVQELVEQGLISQEDVANEIHCMHPKFLEHQLQASRDNLGLETIDLMYLHNAYESQSHVLVDLDAFYDRLAKAFEFYEAKRQEGDIQYYGMATWLCFRAKLEEEKIYLNLQKTMEVAEKVGGKDTHGFRFIQVPIGVMMPEALVEKWQEYELPVAGDSVREDKVLVAICNLLQMNVMVSKPVLEGAVKEIKIPTITNIPDEVSKHLQLVRSMPPRCIISTMCGMKSISNINNNFNVIQRESLNKQEFLTAMNIK
jgi:diketogulonate reductase-like aldo/keto reductase